MQLSAGNVLQNGKYLLNHALDGPGSGVTYRATLADTHQVVIIKTLNPRLKSSPQADRLRQNFDNRVSALKQAHHPSIVTVLDSFQEQNWPYVVLDLISGQPLSTQIETRQTLPEIEVFHALKQIIAALQVAHSQGLVHGNLSPRQIIQRAGSRDVVLVGWSALGVIDRSIDRTQDPYCPPETSQGPLTPQSDVYRVAATVYHCLSGHPPVVSLDQTPLDILDRLPLLSLIHPAFQPLIRQGMALPSTRPPTLEALARLLPRPGQGPKAQPLAPGVVKPSHSHTIASHTIPVTPPALASIEPTQSTQSLPVTSPSTPPRMLTQPLPDPKNPAPGVTAVATKPATRPSNHTAAQKGAIVHAARGAMVPNFIPEVLRIPRRWLVLTGAVAGALGVGFGLALRFSAASSPGSSIFHVDQTFPSKDWQGTLEPTASEQQDIPVEALKSGEAGNNPILQEAKPDFPEPIEIPPTLSRQRIAPPPIVEQSPEAIEEPVIPAPAPEPIRPVVPRPIEPIPEPIRPVVPRPLEPAPEPLRPVIPEPPPRPVPTPLPIEPAPPPEAATPLVPDAPIGKQL